MAILPSLLGTLNRRLGRLLGGLLGSLRARPLAHFRDHLLLSAALGLHLTFVAVRFAVTSAHRGVVHRANR